MSGLGGFIGSLHHRHGADHADTTAERQAPSDPRRARGLAAYLFEPLLEAMEKHRLKHHQRISAETKDVGLWDIGSGIGDRRTAVEGRKTPRHVLIPSGH